MHELSIALSLLDLATEEAERRGNARIVAIHLRLGPLAGVVKNALCSAFELAREGTTLAHVKLIIEDVALLAYCPRCEAECAPCSLQDLSCPTCHSPTPDLRHGRELEVRALEIET